MVRASGEALHHAAHAGGIGNRAKASLPIALDARRLGGEATEWLGAGGARSQGQSADTQEDRDGDTHRCDLVKLGEWSAEDGDMSTPGEQHMHTLCAQRRERLDSISALPIPKAGARASSVSHSLAAADHGIHRLHWIVVASG